MAHTHIYKTGHVAAAAPIAGGDRKGDLLSFVLLNDQRAISALQLGVCTLKVGCLPVTDIERPVCSIRCPAVVTELFFLSVQQATPCRRREKAKARRSPAVH